MKNEMRLAALSNHLFWDIDINTLDLEKNKKQIIHRVLDYGLIDDWKFIQNYYGISKIAETALTIRDLEKKSATFIALLANIPKEKFLCYTTTQSTPQHWNF